MAVTTTGSLLQVLDPAKEEIFLDGAISGADIDSFLWCKIRPATTRTIERASISGPGSYLSKAEGSDYAFSEVIQGNSKTYTMSESAIAFQVSALAYRFIDPVVMGEHVAAIGRSATRKLNADAYGVIAGGFSDVGPDGLPLFSAAHTLDTGATTSNTASNALSESSLQSALAVMRREVAPSGVLNSSMPRFLVVPPELEFTAKELVQSDVTDSNLQVNVIKSKGLVVLTSPALSDSNDWFLRSEDFRAYQFVAKGPQPKGYIDQDSDNFKIKDSLISTQGYDNWRGSFGASVA